MDYDPDFVYIFLYIIQLLLDLRIKLNLSIWTDIHIYICILLIYLHVFFNVSIVNFMKYVLNANPRYNSHMHQLMNFDFLEYD